MVVSRIDQIWKHREGYQTYLPHGVKLRSDCHHQYHKRLIFHYYVRQKGYFFSLTLPCAVRVVGVFVVIYETFLPNQVWLIEGMCLIVIPKEAAVAQEAAAAAATAIDIKPLPQPSSTIS